MQGAEVVQAAITAGGTPALTHPDDDPKWSPEERSIAVSLRSVGYRVTPGGQNENGRLYDFTLNLTERADGKSPEVGASSGTMRNRARESARFGGQAQTLVFDLRGTLCDATEARRGVNRIRGLYGPNGVHGHVFDRILVIGDDYYFEEVL